ncbi:radical SAM protein [Methanolobus halotolerans]|nr:radical SAM protein [Methanolobus halotolerans]
MPELFMERYSEVTVNKVPAGNNILRYVDVSFEKNLTEKELWNIHDEGMQRYRELEQDPFLTRSHISHPEAGKSLLDLKIELSERIMQACHLCQHRCMVDRHAGKKGFCGLTDVSKYASEFLHMGEELQLVPSHTIFFTGCVFSCVFCQNQDISTHPESGKIIRPKEIASIVGHMHEKGSRNVNFVTPTPHLTNILKVIREIKVNIPIVWNSNMYHSPESAALLEGVVDLYLGDFKYGNDICADRYSRVRNYTHTVENNFKLANKQADILIRHLVMPGHLECCTKPIMKWIAENTPHVRLNLMFQYTPHHMVCRYPEIDRFLTQKEKRRALQIVKEEGLEDILI